jgi:biotin synthase-like enzyme
VIPEGIITELVKYGGNLFTEAEKLAHKRDLILYSPLVIGRDGMTAVTNVGEVVSHASYIERSGVVSISLVSGCRNNSLPASFYDCIACVRKNTALDISINFGALGKSDLTRLKEVGANSVFCALPASDFRAAQELSPDITQSRLKTLKDARDAGLKTGAGLIIGIDGSFEDIDASIRVIEQLGLIFFHFDIFTLTCHANGDMG